MKAAFEWVCIAAPAPFEKNRTKLFYLQASGNGDIFEEKQEEEDYIKI